MCTYWGVSSMYWASSLGCSAYGLLFRLQISQDEGRNDVSSYFAI